VRKGGNRLRINCQLIEAERGTHVWADKYDGALEDVFDLQDRITESVVGVIEPNVRRAEIERARRKRPESLRAYDLYLRALPYFASDMPDDARRGMELLEQALTLDPNYAPAHAFLAWGMEMRVVRAGFNAADAQAGLHHAHAALAAPTDDTTALAVASFVILHLGHDFDLDANSIKRAIALNGSCATAFYFGSHIHAVAWDAKIAEDYAERALRLNPFDPFIFEAYLALGMVRLREGQDDDAAAHFAKAVHSNPYFSTLYTMLSGALALAGRSSEARGAAARLIKLEPGFRIAPLTNMASGFTLPSLLSRWSEGMQKAGLPE
jgi:adenylate cyclase